MDEGKAKGRADRRESERRGQDDRLGVLRAAEGGRAGLDAAALGGGGRVARPWRVHDGRRSQADRGARRPVRGRVDDEAVTRGRAARAPVASSDTTARLWFPLFFGKEVRHDDNCTLRSQSLRLSTSRSTPL